MPLWIAGSVDNALRRTARLGDGWFPDPPSPQTFTEQGSALDGFAQEAGVAPHDLHRAVYTTLNINDDVAQAEQELRDFIEGYYHTPFDVMAKRQSVCFGTVDTCTTWIKDFMAAGAQTVVVRFGCPDQVGQLERFTKDVMTHISA
ncbi:hypothetical protein C2W62_22395 [Candidatus Entotheonella serta]|nr:hypothetical protein C2W62_22395 [Candidatus Entotheonella serta]